MPRRILPTAFASALDAEVLKPAEVAYDQTSGCFRYGNGQKAGGIKLLPRVTLSIKDRGAAGDGTTDDTAADDVAIAAVKAAGGGVLQYPSASGYLTHGSIRQPGLLAITKDFPAYDHVAPEPPGPFRAYAKNIAGSPGVMAVNAITINGTEVPFTTLGHGDSVAVSGWTFSGPDAPNPVCAANFGSRYRSLPPGINWGVEIDMNNESPTPYSSGDPRGGQALVIATGSTYSPDAAMVIQRATGEGSGPGYNVGARFIGVRDAGMIFRAMSPASYPGMTPAAPGTLTIIISSLSNDAFNRLTVSESGRMDWGNGSSPQDTTLQRVYGGGLSCNTLFQASSYYVGGAQVLGAQQPAIPNPTGGVTVDAQSRTTISSILAALRAHGIIAT